MGSQEALARRRPRKRLHTGIPLQSPRFQDFAEWPEQLSPKRQSELDERAPAGERSAIETPTPPTIVRTTSAADNVVDVWTNAAKPGGMSEKDERREQTAHAARMFAWDSQIARDPRMRNQGLARAALSIIRERVRWWSGVAEVEVPWLAEKLGCSVRGLQKAMSVATDRGHLARQVRNANLSNLWRPILQGRTVVHPSGIRDEPQFTPDPNTGSPQTRTPVHPSTHSDDSLGGGSAPHQFNKLWEASGRIGNLGAAVAEWGKLSAQDQGAVLDHLSAVGTIDTGTIHLSVWLKNRRWEAPVPLAGQTGTQGSNSHDQEASSGRSVANRRGGETGRFQGAFHARLGRPPGAGAD